MCIRDSDKGAIIWFLNQHWGSRHPLVNLPDLFEYYYVNGDKLQFVLAFEDGRMVAVAGYILANRSDTPDAWVSIWCAAGGANGVGLQRMEAPVSYTHLDVYKRQAPILGTKRGRRPAGRKDFAMSSRRTVVLLAALCLVSLALSLWAFTLSLIHI